MPLKVGQILDEKYRIVRLVGEGGMGAVYEAEHTFLGKHVAIKVLSPEFAHKKEAVKRFYREAQAAARIGHENICEVIDVGQTVQSPYIVMQLLEGRSLARVIVESAPLPVGRAVDIAQQALEALAVAHATGIVHRDLKPDNIFLTKVAGRGDFVKLLDFGISKVRASDTGTKLTQEGSVLGTPQYMSPEQARGKIDVDGRADIWAVGVIIFEMLTGRIPFEGANYNQVIFNVVSEPIPRLRALREGITPELEAVVMRALERDLDRRYPMALHFRDALLGAWMSTRESGFAVKTSITVPSPGDDATELAPHLLPPSTGPKRAAGMVIGTPVPTPGPSGAPRIPAVSNVFLAEPVASGDVPLPPAGGGPPTPRSLVAAASLAKRGTVEVTPGATVVRPPAATQSRPQARRVPLVPALLLAAVVVGGGAYFLLRGGGETTAPDATTVVTAAAPDAGVGEAAVTPLEPPPAVPVVELVKPPSDGATLPPVDVKVEDAGPQPPASDVATVTTPPVEPVDAAAATSPDAGRAQPVRTGMLSVTTSPRVEIYLDDEPLGRSPINNRAVPVGVHRLRFVEQSAGISVEEEVRITAGEVTTILRTATQLGIAAAPGTPSDGGGAATSTHDAGRVRDTIRIRTGVYGRDAG
ncbi:MAG: protein kinase [Deltaproteobacteria bacterium]|nr:protein kinase [Deltaproteobacteria bacterium]